ncbi:hypothetical protein FACS1894166_01660 [Bacilli bacterium]|nr:hypothetical protein FACS1894166_01660 [Bacilli bacterium]
MELNAKETLNLVMIPRLAIGRLIYLAIALALYSLPGFIKSTVFSRNNQKHDVMQIPKNIMNGTKIDSTSDNHEKLSNVVGSIQ